MSATVSRPGGPPSLAARTLTGVGLGWIVLPLLVLAAVAGRGKEGGDLVGPVLASAIIAGAAGMLIGAMRLGRSGLIGAVGGAFGGPALAYASIPPLLGLKVWEIGVYGEYLPGMLIAAVVASIGMGIGARSHLQVTVRPTTIVAAGLFVLVLWFGFWLVVASSLGRAA